MASTSIDNRFIWLGGKLVRLPDAKINVLSSTAQFGANVFEGIRCYWNEKQQQLYAFRLDDHYKRLLNSVKMFGMESAYTAGDFQKALVDVVRANDYKEDIAVRQTVFVDGLGSWFSKGPVNMFVAPVPKKRTAGETLKCCISTWERINDRSVSPKIKVGANYINSRMAQLEAFRNGYDSAIFLNDRGTVAEGPGSCFFMVRDGVLITPPPTASVLESITRDTIMFLANRRGYKVAEREIDRTELYICDEAFLCGSAMEIEAIESVDGYPVGNGRFPITDTLHRLYIEAVSGKNVVDHWLTPIYE